MRHTPLLLCCAVLMESSSHATTPNKWDGDFHPAKVSYLAYSGTLGEKEPPKAGKQKLSLMIEGQIAQELFESLGPDQKQACGGETSGVRIRQRGDVSCSYDRNAKASHYTCQQRL